MAEISVISQVGRRLSLPAGFPDYPLFNTRALEVSRRRGTHRRGALIGVKTHGNGKAKLSLGNGQISLGAAIKWVIWVFTRELQ